MGIPQYHLTVHQETGILGFQIGIRIVSKRIILEEYATLLKNKSVIYKRNYEYPEYWSKTRFDIITKIFTRKRILQTSTKENKN